MTVFEFLDPEYWRKLTEAIKDGVSIDKPIEYTVASGRSLVVPELAILVVPGQIWAIGNVEVHGELVVV